MSKRKLEALAARALEIVAERDKVEDLVIVSSAKDVVPSTGKSLFKFLAVKKKDQNGPHYMVVLDETRAVVDLESLSEREGVELFALPEFVVELPPLKIPKKPITIDPTVNDLVIKEGDTFDEVVTVTVPKDTTVPKVDVYFLADATGSMTSIIAAVKAGADAILGALGGLGIDMAFGVGNYKDFPHDPDYNPYAFQHQLNPTTNVGDAATAISAWSASGGLDYSEGQLFALDQLAQPPGGTIGWRPDSKRIIVWFGDWPGHDPVCQAISGLAYDITEASATSKLVAENIPVIAISTVTGAPAGLDDDPTSNAGDYIGTCIIGGTPGQATRIAGATGGAHETGIDAGNIVAKIIEMVESIVTKINNLNLVPSGGTAPFVTSISPAGGYGPLPGDESHVLRFNVCFTGVVPCDFEDQVFTGKLDVVADGVVVATKTVTITVPRCTDIYSYSAKFVCGVQENGKRRATTVRPGKYATEVNIHNYNENEVRIRKYVLPLVLGGKPIGREPRLVGRKAEDRIVLPPDTATMDDCYRIAEMLHNDEMPVAASLMIGYLEIVSIGELNVDVVYTATDLCTRTVSIDVERVQGKLKYKSVKPEA
ncbi:MAG: hypothetical protein SXV54_17795 [Chloroflexota bacterium]|nr:hypothetical protein [Chloroflexota bacterium]